MNIRIIQIGKTKNKSIAEIESEFTKRIGPFAKIVNITHKEQNPTKTFSRQKCLEMEGDLILKSVPDNCLLVILDERGNSLCSTDFANMLSTEKNLGREICFVIGGAFGLADKVRERGDKILSLSKMTFTHEMSRVILLEQLYRGLCILSGKEYHVA